ncbi:MAG: glycosyltransferase [Lachnospiraceae bacterium]|nr:glycosyltransferase [Lachnospiraceae bacterium]
MNICLLNDSFPPVIDGVANVVMNYAGIMSGYPDTKVVVATPRYPDADYSRYPYHVIPYSSIDTTHLVDGYRTGNPFPMHTVDEIARFGPDIVHTHCPASSALLARILQHETGAPIVFSYHTKFDVDIARAVGEGFLKKETIRAMVSNISACDEVWTVSRGAGENLRSLGYEGDYRVMINGVDFEKGQAADEKVKEVTRGYDLPSEIPVFLYVGRIIRYKGLPMILEALRDLSRKGITFRMVFVGGGPDKEELEKTAAGYGIGNSVIFTGPIHDREALRAWNTRADLFLFPSTYDTNGIVVREAAACALASVLIEGSCAAEGITHARNGYLIGESAEAMARFLEEAVKDPEALRTVGINAMNEIYVSWEESVKNAYERYAEIREMIADGTLTRRRKHMSDRIIDTTADVGGVMRKIFDVPHNLYEGMMENVSEFAEGFREELRDLKDAIPETVREEFHELKEAIPENVRSFQEKTKEGLKKGLDFVGKNMVEGLTLGLGERTAPEQDASADGHIISEDRMAPGDQTEKESRKEGKKDD